MDRIEAEILVAVNDERSKEKLPAICLDESLRNAARSHSDDMLRRGFFDHINPSGEGPAERIGREHRQLIGFVGENIWASSGSDPAGRPALAGEIVRDWMNSPGHRENILRRGFTHLGVGVSVSGFEVRATQEFAGLQGRLAEPLPSVVRKGKDVDLWVLQGSDSPRRTPRSFVIYEGPSLDVVE